ncbi:FAD-dependent monooxygenase [Massilia jejuensis]|uniref:FAD-dependent monooxygenase n=1 Tax=Massilia jejuensis TaxID=648894 RepID=A0ABW0PLI5_9BURK
MKASDVLIVGAGPSGLVLALWLKAMGVDVRIVDAAGGPGTTSRALAIQARTLELYRQLGLAQPVLEAGYPIDYFNLWAEGKHRARIALGAVGAGLTPYPFLHIYPQDRHERLLVERLAQAGLEVERNVSLSGFDEHGDHVVARLHDLHDVEERCAARWLIGCDGARSAVRNAIGVGFPGGAYRQMFYVADIEGDSPALNGELNVDLDESDLLVVFATAPGGRGRLVGTVREELAERAESLQFADVAGRAIDNLMIKVTRVDWFATYRVHHRIAEHFRRGRAFLVGDAGHIHSPAGGQGMNSGIGDAVNLAWKLAAVLQGQAPESMLDSYEAERLPCARRLVATTDRAFGFLTADGPVAEIVRTGIVPSIMPLIGRLPSAREYFFRTISQTLLRYRHAPLNAGRAGRVRGGDRLPWVAYDTGDNFAPLPKPGWQAHLYGSARPDVITWCALHGVPLRQYEWHAGCAAAGLAPGACYLLRPDTYVGLAAGTPSIDVLDGYLRANGLRL